MVTKLNHIKVIITQDPDLIRQIRPMRIESWLSRGVKLPNDCTPEELWYDEYDFSENAFHFIAYINGEIAGAARLLSVTDPATVDLVDDSPIYERFKNHLKLPCVHWGRLFVRAQFRKMNVVEALHVSRMEYAVKVLKPLSMYSCVYGIYRATRMCEDGFKIFEVWSDDYLKINQDRYLLIADTSQAAKSNLFDSFRNIELQTVNALY